MVVTALGNGNLQAICEFQKKFNLSLSADYIDFLLTMNGVISQDDTTIKVAILEQEIEIDSLFGINLQQSWLDVKTWMGKYASELPENALIIGCDLLNNLIVMLESGEDAGIYYWDASYSFEESKDNSNAYFIAHSFQQFREMLGDFIERK